MLCYDVFGQVMLCEATVCVIRHKYVMLLYAWPWYGAVMLWYGMLWYSMS